MQYTSWFSQHCAIIHQFCSSRILYSNAETFAPSSWNFGPKTKEVCITADFPPEKIPARKPEAESIYHSYLIMHMGGSLTIFWDEGELSNSVMLFYMLLLSLLSFPVCPTDSMPNWESSLICKMVVLSDTSQFLGDREYFAIVWTSVFQVLGSLTRLNLSVCCGG